MNGVIKAVIRKREGQNGGFFFITGEDGTERFAHASNLFPPASFPGTTPRETDIREGQNVDFEPVTIPGKGERADRVRVL